MRSRTSETMRGISVPIAEKATQIAQAEQERNSALERIAQLANQLEEERAGRKRDAELAQSELRRLEREMGKMEGRIEEMLKAKGEGK